MDLVFGTLTPLQLESFMGTNLLEISTERFWGSKGVLALVFGNLTPLQLKTLLGTNLLVVSMVKDLGALERGEDLS